MDRYGKGRPLGAQQLQVNTNAWPITYVGVGKPPRPVPILEKHQVDQLSIKEQDSLNIKFKLANDAAKKVGDLEKDILEAKQKNQFYLAKMQELVLYKSRCDIRLNEITEEVVGVKREAESLAKKYEEKYKQVGDVASRLSIEEATFRDIQEKKMELYRAIATLEQDNAGDIQDRADQIQSDLEELVKGLNERCKTYGLRGKPTALVELPFGWQPGIGGATADWDEAWDEFEDEGFTYVKELTLDARNVAAPPKPKSSLIREKVTPLDNSGGIVKSPSKANDKSEQPTNDKSEQPNFEERLPENEMSNGSPRAFDNQSDYGGAESVLSGDKSFDKPSWDSFDTYYDADVRWDFNPDTRKDVDSKRHNESSLFGGEETWGLSPIRTGPTPPYTNFPKQGPIFDSVPSTPLYTSATPPNTDNIFANKSPLGFADSGLYNYSSSPRKFSEGSFSRFDSFNMNDFGPFGSSSTRFDSTRDSEFDQGGGGSLARYDSFRSTTDSDYNFGQFPSQDSFTRFDSKRSGTINFDSGHGFPSFDDVADPFGSSGPFKAQSSLRKDSDSWEAF